MAPSPSSSKLLCLAQSTPSCSPTGPGTQAQPYCTIPAALNAHSSAGVTIRVKPWTYREQWTVNASGVFGGPILIEAVGSGVIVDAGRG